MNLLWIRDSSVQGAANGTRQRWTNRPGARQSYVEDCQVCCKPNVLDVRYDPEEQEFLITARLE